ncbi:MAG: phage minor capsid protein [Oscillospiraceae bacterium]|nr:phage minor capsid protein [Oscillospiraceae bacterium]
MLTAQQIAALRDAASKITDPINDYLIQDIARRIAEAGQLTSTAAYQVWRMQQLGKSQREFERELRRLLQQSRKQIRKILHQSAQSGYGLDINRFPTSAAIPFEKNTALQQIVSAAVELAQEDFTNIVQTIGFVNPFGKPEPLTSAYITSCDFAFKQVVTGAASYTEAIRQATRNLAAKGVRVIDYESGVHTSLEAAVRRNIMGGLGLMQEQISQQVHDDLGCDGWEITAHANSAPDHEPIQGRQYSDAAYTALNNALRRRIGTLNCGHAAFPIILGVNQPQYTAEELEKFRTDNEKGVTVDGVHYTGYRATQMQRSLERAIRAQKRKVMVDEATGDGEKLARDKTRLELLHQRYREFSKAAGLRTQYERTEVAGFGEKPQQLLESDIGDAVRRMAKSIAARQRVVGFSGLPKEMRRSFCEGLAGAAPEAKEVLRNVYRKTDYVVSSEKRSYYSSGFAKDIVHIGTKAEPSALAHELFHKLDTGHEISRTFTWSLAKDHVALDVISGGNIKGYLVREYPEAFGQRSKTGAPLNGRSL